MSHNSCDHASPVLLSNQNIAL